MLAQNLLWKNIDELWAFITDILGDGTKRVLISAVWYRTASSWMVITACVLTPLRHISSGSQPDKCPANCFLARKSLLSPCCWGTPPTSSLHSSLLTSPPKQTSHLNSTPACRACDHRGRGRGEMEEDARENPFHLPFLSLLLLPPTSGSQPPPNRTKEQVVPAPHPSHHAH